MPPKPDHEALVAKQRERKGDTRKRVLKAMRTIRREIAEHGLYPRNDGKVTLAEVLTRAGVGGTTLRNRHHLKTRKRVQKWLKILSGGAPTTKTRARRASHEKIAWYETALRKVNAEVVKCRRDRQLLVEENTNLRRQVNAMGADRGSKVLGIKSRQDDND